MIAGLGLAWLLGKPEAPAVSQARAPAMVAPGPAPQDIPEGETLPPLFTTSAPAAPRTDYDGPLAEIVPTHEESMNLHEAEELAVENCMNERGFEYRPAPFLAQGDVEPWLESKTEGDIEMASSIGYGMNRSLAMEAAPMPPMPNEALIEVMNPEELIAWDRALSGMSGEEQGPSTGPGWVSMQVPDTGEEIRWDSESCFAQSWRAVHGDDRLHMEDAVIEELLFEKAHRLINTYPAYQLSLKRWQACMASKGLHFEAPGDPEQSLWEAMSRGEITREALEAREIELATAEAVCYGEAGVEQALRSAQARADEVMRAAQAEDIHRIVTRRQEALERARQAR